jgi:hypothetical protein
MHRFVTSMLATVALIAASLAAAKAQTCPAANDPSLPKGPGVYVQSNEGWFALSNPEFYNPGPWNWHSFIGSPGATHEYLMFDDDKAKYRADVAKLVFLVRGLPGWKKAIFLMLDTSLSQRRKADITGDPLTERKREATILVIQTDLRCVRPNSSLGKGEYVLVLYSTEQMPTKRGNFFDFGID